jgi:uncharacterized membrane protein HdeD (DUF308 family)
VLNDISKVTRTMPESTTSQQFGSKLEPANDRASSMKRPGERSAVEELLRWLTRSLAILAVLSSVALLCVGVTPMLSSFPAAIATQASRCWALLKNVPLSALPLLLAGISYLVLQVIVRPRPLELFKRVMLAAAFLLWGIVQLMPAGNLASELGNLVIALYVIDLGLIIWTDLEKNRPRLAG